MATVVILLAVVIRQTASPVWLLSLFVALAVSCPLVASRFESDVAVVAFGDCRNNTMRTTGQHAATDVDFEEYTAKTNSGGVDIAC